MQATFSSFLLVTHFENSFIALLLYNYVKEKYMNTMMLVLVSSQNVKYYLIYFMHVSCYIYNGYIEQSDYYTYFLMYICIS